MAPVEFNTVIEGGEPSWSYEPVDSIDFNNDFDPGWASELNYPPHWFDSINLDDNQADTSTPITPSFPIYQLDPCESNLSSKTCYLSDKGETFEEKTITDETNSYDDRNIFQKVWHNIQSPNEDIVMPQGESVWESIKKMSSQDSDEKSSPLSLAEEKAITDETNSYDDRNIFQKIWHNLFIPSDQVVMKG